LNRLIVTCTGYGGTGSSAITDLLKEFDNGFSLGNAELWFLQGYDGVSDLEYFLIDGNHRSKVNLAIKRFKIYVNEYNGLYSKYFGNKYKEYSDDYIEALTDAKFKKSISYYEIDSAVHKFLLFRASPLLQKVIAKFFKKDFKEFSPYIPIEDKVYSIPNRERFYKITSDYTTKLFDAIDNNYNFIAVDQLVPAMNAGRYLNYVNNLKIIIVDRDPRDLFLLNELHWKKAAYICDTTNVDEFITWYRAIREHRKFEEKNENIIYIMLEDLIYNNDKTLELVCNFLNIDRNDHVRKGHFFRPDASMKHTKIWKKFPEYRAKDVNKIQKELYEYCFKG
jgi:hypothetical protein